jgi:hypothetical protein
MAGAQKLSQKLHRLSISFSRSWPALRDWLVVAASVGIPVLAALGGSYLVGSEAFHAQDTQNRQSRMDEVRSQSRLLLENVWEQIDSFKVRAVSSSLPKSALDPEVKALGEISFNANGAPIGVKNLKKNEAWLKAGAPREIDSLIEAAATHISTREIQEAGISLVLVPKAQGQTTQYVGAAIQSGHQLIFAVADPMDLFSRFSRWSSHREAGNLRAFLVSSSGKVIAHSERIYAGSDFSSSDVYLQALRPLFRDQRTGGVATFRSVDLRPVMTAYARVEHLPFAVVVERVVKPMGIADSSMRQVFIPSILLLTATLVISLFSMIGIQKYFEITHGERMPRNAVFEQALSRPLESALDRMAAHSAIRADEARNMRELRDRLRDQLGTNTAFQPTPSEPEIDS